MGQTRREFLATGLAAGLAMVCPDGQGGDLAKITVSLPGPKNLTYLPIDLIPLIQADLAEGATLQLVHTSGGGIALKELTSHNVDFSVTGLPSQLSLRVNKGEIVTVMAVNDLPLFLLLVRHDLRETVTRIQDLRGRIIGVTTSSLFSKTTAQQLAELLLSTSGVSAAESRFLPIGQDWETRSAMLRAGRVDAVIAEEPFASRLNESGLSFTLVSLANPDDVKTIPGGGFLFATLATRLELVAREPDKVKRMVAMVRRSLSFLSTHSPEEIVAKRFADGGFEADRQSLLASLRRYPRLFSPDGRFSTRQLQETEVFFRASAGEDPRVAGFQVESMIDDRWAGRKE